MVLTGARESKGRIQNVPCVQSLHLVQPGAALMSLTSNTRQESRKKILKFAPEVAQAGPQQQQQQQEQQHSRDTRWEKFMRSYLTHMIKYCQYNPANQREGFGPSIRRAHLPWWCHLAEIYYVYFTIKLTIAQVLQHKYSLLIYDLETLEETSVTASGHDNVTTSQFQVKQAELADVVAHIEWIGNPVYENGFAGEVLFCFVLFLWYMAKVQSPLFVRLRGPVRYSLTQMLLDPERERKLTMSRVVEREIRRLIVSSESFRRARRAAIERSYALSLKHGLILQRDSTTSAHQLTNYLRALCNNKLASEDSISMIRELSKGEQLVAPNRRPEWRHEISKIYGCTIVLTQLWGLVGDVSSCIIAPTIRTLIKFNTRPRDLFVYFEFILYVAVGTQWLIFYFVLFECCVIDLGKFVGELRTEVAGIIGEINRVSSPAARTRLDTRIMRLLIHYKLLHEQLRDTKPPIGYSAAHLIFLVLALPLVGRIYAGHLKLEIRFLVLVFSLFYIISVNALIIPYCRLYARCCDLLTSMSTLLAHLIARQEDHDAHLIWLLRKRLSAPDETMRRFAFDAFFLRLTYASWLGIHFYCGILMAPLLLRDTASLKGNDNLLAEAMRIL